MQKVSTKALVAGLLLLVFTNALILNYLLPVIGNALNLAENPDIFSLYLFAELATMGLVCVGISAYVSAKLARCYPILHASVIGLAQLAISTFAYTPVGAIEIATILSFTFAAGLLCARQRVAI